MKELESQIEAAYDRINDVSREDAVLLKLLDQVFEGLGAGVLRVAEKRDGEWVTIEWLKKAILLSFKVRPTVVSTDGLSFDRIPLKFADWGEGDYRRAGIRVSQGAVVRTGTYIGSEVVLMPSFVNIGAYIGSGCMVDTWATVGSCAQIGKNVHLSGGVGIGGVLEPLQSSPTIIEDNCFIGARSEVVEGVVVEENSVLGMGVFISQSTPIYDRNEDKTIFGRVPSGSVIVPGVINKNEHYGLASAVIVKRVDAQTRSKTSVNELLRTS